MRVILQRTTAAKVEVAKEIVGQIKEGLVILVGFTAGDNITTIKTMVKKIINLRIFNDEKGVMNYSLQDIKGSILSISQFTLYADTKKGRRPSYSNALKAKEAETLYNLFNQSLKENGIKTETGVFGAKMEVTLVNKGPVTIYLDSTDF